MSNEWTGGVNETVFFHVGSEVVRFNYNYALLCFLLCMGSLFFFFFFFVGRRVEFLCAHDEWE